MLKMFEFECRESDCYGYHYIVERLIKAEAVNEQICDKCLKPLIHILSAPHGYVKGTANPVKF